MSTLISSRPHDAIEMRGNLGMALRWAVLALISAGGLLVGLGWSTPVAPTPTPVRTPAPAVARHVATPPATNPYAGIKPSDPSVPAASDTLALTP